MRKCFDPNKMCQHVWDVLWANNLAQRAKEKKNPRWANSTYYLTAADIVRGVRNVAAAQLRGEEWPATYDKVFWGSDYGLRVSGDVQGEVRDWLFANPKLTYHNFGRGHISGARFRPVGEPMGPSESETLKKKAERRANPRPRTVHFTTGYTTLLCTKNRRSPFSRPSKAWTTKEEVKVTCPQCKNLLAAKKLERA